MPLLCIAVIRLAEASNPSTSYIPTFRSLLLEGTLESCHCHDVFIAGCHAVLPWAKARGIANVASTRDKRRMRGNACFMRGLSDFWTKRARPARAVVA